MDENLNSVLDVEVNVSDKTGRSPFIYLENMGMEEEECQKECSLPYFRKCIADNVISNIKFDILKCVYKHAYLNKYILGRMLSEKYPESNLKDAISWLVKRGMLHRLKFVKDGYVSRYFYCVGEGVAKYMKGGTPRVADAVSAIYDLCRAQFAACAECYDGFVRADIHTEFMMVNAKNVRKQFDLGYHAVIKCGSGKRITLLAIAIRRSPGWQTELRNALYIAGAYASQNGRTFPVLICEDGSHMIEAAKVIRETAQDLLGHRILFTDDHSTAEWNLNNALLIWDGNRKFESDEEDFAIFSLEKI